MGDLIDLKSAWKVLKEITYRRVLVVFMSKILIFCSFFLKGFRLNSNSGTPYSGKVEVLHANRWFGLFRNLFKRKYQRRICNVLGYPGAMRIWIYKTKQRQLVATIMKWNGTEVKYRVYIGGVQNVAGLTCKKAIRLVNSDNGNNSDHYGIVEIYRDAKWWKLSDNQWSNADANVACHYLGYDRASEIYTETFSRINATILSVDFKCRGNEGELADCFQEQRKTNASYKAKGSGVRCTVDGEELCKTCECQNRSVNCYGKNLNWMPWIPKNYTAENIQEYLLGKNAIHTVNKFHLREFTYVRKLDLSENHISSIAPNLFAFTGQLSYLNLSGNRIESLTSEMMRNLHSLTVLYTDRFTHCCHAKKINPEVNCFAPADVFSSCSELLKNDFLEVFVWIVALMVACGNLGVIFVRFNVDTRGLQTLFINSLVSSDILMSIYLLIIGYNNVTYKGKYFEHDEKWRSSKSCTVAGVISLISSQVSLFMITAITTERYWSIVHNSKRFSRFGSKLSWNIVSFAWLFGGAIAIFPAVFPRYFNSTYMTFYGQNSVCLPLQLPDENREVLGWEYCLGLFGCINAVLCIYVTTCYIRMYMSLKQNDIRNTTTRKQEDSYLAKRMFGIVVTNLCCWIPVVTFTFLSLHGLTSHVKTLHAWSAVCLFPINAALNPVIYTFFAPRVKKKINNLVKLADRRTTKV
ncbi:G- coupled receptor GRL101-like [Paramuricea clavata]|uniref:G- coupled receptor GRL101-like n=1 Tax=Paramuricea clavata TaxID=317549 RepID=A0A7D9IQ39_PARCT|nr:G- coupled receptor GRL101-like [Paramuricea clavata]